nr:hypothetical protein [Streptomyces aurantiacus]
MFGDLLGLDEGLQVDQCLMGGFRGPHPFFHRVGPVLPFSFARSPVPHHVAGVLGVGEHVADVGVRPAAHRSVRVDRGRGRIGDQVGVESVRNALIAQAFHDAPGECLTHHRSFDGMCLKKRLLDAFRPLGRNRVRNALGLVAVARFADVVAVLGVDFEAVPRLLQHLGDVPLGDALLDPPGEHLSGRFGLAHVVEPDGLVRGQECHAHLFQPVLDLGGDVGASGDPVDRFADHRVEPAVGALRLFEEILNAAVPGDGDLEEFVCVAPAPVG